MPAWDKLVALLGREPATFWGVVTGSFLTLIGVIATNKGNDRRLAAQLTHDREMQARERDQILRKDIYLAAAEAIQAGVSAIPRFGDLNIPHNDLLKDYTQKAPSIAKV